MKKRKPANPFLMQVTREQIVDFCEKNMKDCKIVYVRWLATARQICYSKDGENQKMTFYDCMIVPKNENLEKEWTEYMHTLFGKEYAEAYL